MTEQDRLFAPIVAAFAHDPDVTFDERVFASKPLKVRGKIFAMLVDGCLVVKLPKEEVDNLVSARKGQRFDPGHGRLMKQWVVLSQEHLDQWMGAAKRARALVGGPPCH